MDDISSGCSSGCESGWTTYFDQISCNSYSRVCVTNSEAKGVYKNEDHEDNGDEEEEEDLSMISDASSGPPNLQEYESKAHGYGYLSEVPEEVKEGNKKSNPEEPVCKKHQILCLEDTASSLYPLRFDETKNTNFLHVYEKVNTQFQFQNESTPYDDQESAFVVTSSSRKHTGFLKSSKGKSGTFLGMKKRK